MDSSAALSQCETETFARFAQQCIQCRSEAEFAALTRSSVRALLPHGSLMAVIGLVDLEHVENCKVVSVDAPTALLAQLPLKLNLRERPVVARWLKDRQPVAVQLPRDAAALSERERFEIETFGLGRLAIHGVLDIHARSGSYFSFAQVAENLADPWLQDRLRLLVPLLHTALVQVADAPVLLPGQDPVVRLSGREVQLLQWLAAGRTNVEIAALSSRSHATVRNQLHNLYGKLGVANRAEAIRVASRAPIHDQP
jgi:DNA-binding CsgD family transcriptional regulator